MTAQLPAERDSALGYTSLRWQVLSTLARRVHASDAGRCARRCYPAQAGAREAARAAARRLRRRAARRSSTAARRTATRSRSRSTTGRGRHRRRFLEPARARARRRDVLRDRRADRRRTTRRLGRAADARRRGHDRRPHVDPRRLAALCAVAAGLGDQPGRARDPAGDRLHAVPVPARPAGPSARADLAGALAGLHRRSSGTSIRATGRVPGPARSTRTSSRTPTTARS